MQLDALAVMLRYRELLEVEDIFRTMKAILDTRPIYHKTDEAIRGRVFKAIGVALPPNIREVGATAPARD